MKITRINNVNWGPRSLTKATFDLETSEGLIIRDCQLKEGQFGMFAEAPQKPCKPYTTKAGTTKEWTDVVSFFGKKGLKEEITELAADAYDPSGEVRSKSKNNVTEIDDLSELEGVMKDVPF